MPGPESQGRIGPAPTRTVSLRWGEIRSDGQATGGNSGHKELAPLRDATGMAQTYRSSRDFDRRPGDPERAQRSHCAGGSHGANPRPGAAPARIRHGPHDVPAAHTESGETQRGNPTGPTAFWHGH